MPMKPCLVCGEPTDAMSTERTAAPARPPSVAMSDAGASSPSASKLHTVLWRRWRNLRPHRRVHPRDLRAT